MEPGPPSEDDGAPILNLRSGYIRFIDTGRLLALAKAWRLRVRVERRVGQFIPAGLPLLRVVHEDGVAPHQAAELLGAFVSARPAPCNRTWNSA